MRNGICWKTIEEKEIQAHGGNIITYNGKYYWYGEDKSGKTSYSSLGTERVDFVGFSCYSSEDLLAWHHEGLVFEAVAQDGHELNPKNIGERPKVVYNEASKKFVLWFHLDDETYNYARAGLATADSPTGPFIYQGSFLPNGSDVRDMTVFIDTDMTGYLIHSGDWNRSLYVSQLTKDYQGFTGSFKKILVDQYREAPAMLHMNGNYYLVTSGCTGWDPNAALYAVADTIFGNWKLIDNPCCGKHRRHTYGAQPSAFVQSRQGQLYLLLDHWKKEQLFYSGYSLLPVQITSDGQMEIYWQEVFDGAQD